MHIVATKSWTLGEMVLFISSFNAYPFVFCFLSSVCVVKQNEASLNTRCLCVLVFAF